MRFSSLLLLAAVNLSIAYPNVRLEGRALSAAQQAALELSGVFAYLMCLISEEVGLAAAALPNAIPSKGPNCQLINPFPVTIYSTAPGTTFVSVRPPATTTQPASTTTTTQLASTLTTTTVQPASTLTSTTTATSTDSRTTTTTATSTDSRTSTTTTTQSASTSTTTTTQSASTSTTTTTQSASTSTTTTTQSASTSTTTTTQSASTSTTTTTQSASTSTTTTTQPPSTYTTTTTQSASTTTTTATSTSTMLVCQPGDSFNNSGVCVPDCAPGTGVPAGTSGACTTCAAGTYSPGGPARSTSCMACPDNFAATCSNSGATITCVQYYAPDTNNVCQPHNFVQYAGYNNQGTDIPNQNYFGIATPAACAAKCLSVNPLNGPFTSFDLDTNFNNHCFCKMFSRQNAAMIASNGNFANFVGTCASYSAFTASNGGATCADVSY